MQTPNLQNPLIFNTERKSCSTITDISDSFIARALSQRVVAIDIETSGLEWRSERIGLCQIALPSGEFSLLKNKKRSKPHKFLALLANDSIQKIFHHAMFDLRFLVHHWGAKPANIACTKIASKLIDAEQTEGHSLAALLDRYLQVKIDKSARQSDWLAWDFSETQIAYASSDVIYLPELLKTLESRLREKSRWELAQKCFDHIPTRVELDVCGFSDVYEY